MASKSVRRLSSPLLHAWGPPPQSEGPNQRDASDQRTPLVVGNMTNSYHETLERAERSRSLEAKRRRTQAARRIFGDLLPYGDEVVDDFMCAYVKGILIQGRMYLTRRHLCFNSVILGKVTRLVVPYASIASVTKARFARVLDNSIAVELVEPTAPAVDAGIVREPSQHSLHSGQTLFSGRSESLGLADVPAGGRLLFTSFLKRQDAFLLLSELVAAADVNSGVCSPISSESAFGLSPPSSRVATARPSPPDSPPAPVVHRTLPLTISSSLSTTPSLSQTLPLRSQTLPWAASLGSLKAPLPLVDATAQTPPPLAETAPRPPQLAPQGILLHGGSSGSVRSGAGSPRRTRRDSNAGSLGSSRRHARAGDTGGSVYFREPPSPLHRSHAARLAAKTALALSLPQNMAVAASGPADPTSPLFATHRAQFSIGSHRRSVRQLSRAVEMARRHRRAAADDAEALPLNNASAVLSRVSQRALGLVAVLRQLPLHVWITLGCALAAFCMLHSAFSLHGRIQDTSARLLHLEHVAVDFVSARLHQAL